MMKIWVDADACPTVIKEILFKVAARAKTHVVFVANQPIHTPPSPWLSSQQVQQGFDIADNYIVNNVTEGDLVITSDIPLAAEVIEKKCLALSPRGELHTEDNIKSRLTMRDFMETMRSSGIQSGGPPPMNLNDRKEFAGHLDRIIARAQRKK